MRCRVPEQSDWYPGDNFGFCSGVGMCAYIIDKNALPCQYTAFKYLFSRPRTLKYNQWRVNKVNRKPDTVGVADGPTMVADTELYQESDTCQHSHPWDDCRECDLAEALDLDEIDDQGLFEDDLDESDDDGLCEDELDATCCAHGIQRTKECPDCDADMERELDNIF